MKVFKIEKDTGCLLQAIEFDNGIVVACWQTGVPEVAVYQTLELFLKVRTKERGYKIVEEIDVDKVTEKAWMYDECSH